MSEIYKKVTDYLSHIRNLEYGKWYPEKQVGDGSSERPFQMPYVLYDDMVEEFIKEVYRFKEEHPEYNLNNYREILEKHNIRLEGSEMINADVSEMDGQGVMALLLASIRADRFCEGILLEFFRNDCIHKWLERLAEIDKQCGK